jgi:hypothetical protein
MEREQILREDFPTERKGWSRATVRAHLTRVADAFAAAAAAGADAPPPVARATAERVETVLAAAEGAADQIRAAARTESEEAVEAATEEAKGRIEQARGAVEGLISQADKLRSQVGALGRDLTSGPAGSKAEVADEELIAQLRSVAPAEAEPEAAPASEPEPPPAVSGSDDGAARLVAMNMALEGASREEIEEQLTSEFGDISDARQLLDDVFRRASR